MDLKLFLYNTRLLFTRFFYDKNSIFFFLYKLLRKNAKLKSELSLTIAEQKLKLYVN